MEFFGKTLLLTHSRLKILERSSWWWILIIDKISKYQK